MIIVAIIIIVLMGLKIFKMMEQVEELAGTVQVNSNAILVVTESLIETNKKVDALPANK